MGALTRRLRWLALGLMAAMGLLVGAVFACDPFARLLVESLWFRRLVPFALVVRMNDGVCRAHSAEDYIRTAWLASMVQHDADSWLPGPVYHEVPPNQHLAERLRYEQSYGIGSTDDSPVTTGDTNIRVCDCGEILVLRTWRSLDLFHTESGTLVAGGTAQEYPAYCGGRSNVSAFGDPIRLPSCRCVGVTATGAELATAADLATTNPRAAVILLRTKVARTEPETVEEIRIGME
jgi:hypothetical protein